MHDGIERLGPARVEDVGPRAARTVADRRAIFQNDLVSVDRDVDVGPWVERRVQSEHGRDVVGADGLTDPAGGDAGDAGELLADDVRGLCRVRPPFDGIGERQRQQVSLQRDLVQQRDERGPRERTEV
jgi:hypothetical protein